MFTKGIRTKGTAVSKYFSNSAPGLYRKPQDRFRIRRAYVDPGATIEAQLQSIGTVERGCWEMLLESLHQRAETAMLESSFARQAHVMR